jgi:hypothetical protein
MHTWTTFTSSTQRTLTQAGLRVIKNEKEACWQVVDGSKVLMQNKALGCLMNKAAKEFGI